MLKQSLVATGLAALALAGGALGSGIIIHLPGGTCATIGHTKVCAIAKTVTKTVTRTKTARTATVTLISAVPAPPTVTVTVGTSATTPAPPSLPPPVTTTTTETVATTTATTATTTPTQVVGRLCSSDAHWYFPRGNLETPFTITNCGDLPLTLGPPEVDHTAPFYPVHETLIGPPPPMECPDTQGTLLLNPGAFCTLYVAFGGDRPPGDYSATWTLRATSLPGVFFTTTIFLTGTLP